mgnify:CR=1 FL=1
MGRLQLRARPQLMRAADEGDAPATTPATQVVRRDLGAYVGLTSIVALVPAVDWAGLGPETSNVARLLYFSAVALGSVSLGVKRQASVPSPISSRSAALAPLFASAVLGGLYAILKFTELDPGAVYRLAARLFDMHTGTMLFSIENEGGCHFTSACWDHEHAELLLGDEQGSLLVWDTTLDQPTLSEKLQMKTLHAASQASKRGGILACKPVAAAEAAARTSVREGGSATAIVGLSILNGQVYTSGGSNITSWALLRGLCALHIR